MQGLTESVYECSLPVEAHMICDLLARADIAARVDGEFLAGAAGELPIGSSIRVRVEPARAAEARAVIDEWEKAQPPDASASVPRPARARGLLWFFLGAVCGAGFVFVVLSNPTSVEGIDYDGDGHDEVVSHYDGSRATLVEFDRDSDGRIDARWHFDLHGLEKSYEADDDFDGRFEWQTEAAGGQLAHGGRDGNGDGKAELETYFEHGVLRRVDIRDEAGERIIAREHYVADRVEFTEFDRDADGVFEQRVEFDRTGMPK